MAAATTTAAAFVQPQHLGREASILLRRHVDFQRLLVATEGAAGRHRELLGRLEQGEEEGRERQCQLELNRLLVVRACVYACTDSCRDAADASLTDWPLEQSIDPHACYGHLIDRSTPWILLTPPPLRTTPKKRLKQFASALREQLTELSGLADYSLGTGRGGSGVDVSPKALQGYGFRLDALERGLLARQQEVC